MYSTIRDKVIKFLAIMDMIKNKEYNEREEFLHDTNFAEMKGSYQHIPTFRDEVVLLAFKNLEELFEFQKACANEYPLLTDNAKFMVQSISPLLTKEGKMYFVASTIKCSCKFCSSKSSLGYIDKVFENFINYNQIEML